LALKNQPLKIKKKERKYKEKGIGRTNKTNKKGKEEKTK
jgi:hypothetical protein